MSTVFTPAVAAVLVLASGAVSAAEAAPGTFRDCPGCPEMVVVPAGSFVMGTPGNEMQRIMIARQLVDRNPA